VDAFVAATAAAEGRAVVLTSDAVDIARLVDGLDTVTVQPLD
jgi:hypothetical protein